MHRVSVGVLEGIVWHKNGCNYFSPLVEGTQKGYGEARPQPSRLSMAVLSM